MVLVYLSEKSMVEVYDAEYCSLHVRCGNKAAFTLYKDTLGFLYVDFFAPLRPIVFTELITS